MQYIMWMDFPLLSATYLTSSLLAIKVRKTFHDFIPHPDAKGENCIQCSLQNTILFFIVSRPGRDPKKPPIQPIPSPFPRS
jgi:hypothetical protein